MTEKLKNDITHEQALYSPLPDKLLSSWITVEILPRIILPFLIHFLIIALRIFFFFNCSSLDIRSNLIRNYDKFLYQIHYCFFFLETRRKKRKTKKKKNRWIVSKSQIYLDTKINSTSLLTKAERKLRVRAVDRVVGSTRGRTHYHIPLSWSQHRGICIGFAFGQESRSPHFVLRRRMALAPFPFSVRAEGFKGG